MIQEDGKADDSDPGNVAISKGVNNSLLENQKLLYNDEVRYVVDHKKREGK